MSTSMEREYWVPSPSLPPSPSQPGCGLLASPEAKQCNPPPLRRSNAPSTLVSQPYKASSTGGLPTRIPNSASGFWKNEKPGYPLGVVWSTKARILPMVAKIPKFPLYCARCAQTPPIASSMLHIMLDRCSTSNPHTHPPLAPQTSAQAQRGASSPPLGTIFASNPPQAR